MLKRRSRLLAGSGALLLVLSISGMAAGAVPPDAEPAVTDTTATFEDVDGNGIDDDCQEVAAVADPATAAAELLTVDLDADGVISTTEAAHSARTGGANCNHGGYVSWIAQQKHECVAEPVVEPTVAETVVLVVTTPPDAEPEVEACEADDDAAITAAKKDKVAAAAARAASKAERTLAREAQKAERQAAKAERTLARETSKAERQAAKAAKHAERQAAKAARTNKGH